MFMNTKCIAHGLFTMSFVFTPIAGRPIRVARSYQGELSHETQHKSALGLCSMNAKSLKATENTKFEHKY